MNRLYTIKDVLKWVRKYKKVIVFPNSLIETPTSNPIDWIEYEELDKTKIPFNFDFLGWFIKGQIKPFYQYPSKKQNLENIKYKGYPNLETEYTLNDHWLIKDEGEIYPRAYNTGQIMAYLFS